MTATKRRVMSAALALGLLVLTTSAQAMTPTEEIAAAKITIDAVNKDWWPALQTRDAKRTVAAYADDGMFIAADGEVIRGRDAIERMMANYYKTMPKVLSATIHSDGLEYAAGAIVEWGHGEISREGKDGRSTSSISHYVTIWKRDAKGAWRIERNILL